MTPQFIRYREHVYALEHVTHARFTPANSRESKSTGEIITDPCKLLIGFTGGVCMTVVGAEAEELWRTFRSLALSVHRPEKKGAKDAGTPD